MKNKRLTAGQPQSRFDERITPGATIELEERLICYSSALLDADLAVVKMTFPTRGLGTHARPRGALALVSM